MYPFSLVCLFDSCLCFHKLCNRLIDEVLTSASCLSNLSSCFLNSGLSLQTTILPKPKILMHLFTFDLFYGKSSTEEKSTNPKVCIRVILWRLNLNVLLTETFNLQCWLNISPKARVGTRAYKFHRLYSNTYTNLYSIV